MCATSVLMVVRREQRICNHCCRDDVWHHCFLKSLLGSEHPASPQLSPRGGHGWHRRANGRSGVAFSALTCSKARVTFIKLSVSFPS